MANRFWVGGTGVWDQSSSSNWSTTSGGASGASAPTVNDDVFFDANSFSAGSQVVTTTGVGTGVCRSLNMTGVTNTPTLSGGLIEVTGGNLVGAGFVNFLTAITMDIGTSSVTIASNSMTYQGDFTVNSTPGTGTVTLLDDLNVYINSTFFIFGGNFNANNFNVTAGSMIISPGAASATLTMGSGTWKLLPGYAIDTIILQFTQNSNLTVVPGASLFYVDLSLFTGSVATLGTGSLSGPLPFYDFLIDGATLGKTVAFEILSGSGDMSFSHALNFQNTPLTVSFAGGATYTAAAFDGNGSAGNLLTFITGSGVATLSSPSPSFSYVDVHNNTAAGATPFDDSVGGVDSGGNTNWFFGGNLNTFLQNVFMIESDPSGSVQMVNVGKSDDGTPIFYELETQELEFGNRAHLKGISDELAVFTKFGTGSNLEAYTDTQALTPIEMTFNNRVNIGKDINLEGHYVTFRWFGQSSTASPIFEGISIENIVDKGMTEP